jgi:hypothetical protein
LERIRQLELLLASGQMDDDDEPQSLLSPDAIRNATDIVLEIAQAGPPGPVGIFPTPVGGLALQAVGADYTVSIEVSDNPDESMLAKYAGIDVFHRETVRDAATAAAFLLTHAR